MTPEKTSRKRPKGATCDQQCQKQPVSISGVLRRKRAWVHADERLKNRARTACPESRSRSPGFGEKSYTGHDCLERIMFGNKMTRRNFAQRGYIIGFTRRQSAGQKAQRRFGVHR